MKRWVVILIVIAITLLTGLQQLTAAPITCDASSSKNYITQTEGIVQLKHEDSKSYSLASIGELLYPGDLLKLEQGAEAVICCAKSSEPWKVPDGTISGLPSDCSPQPSSEREGIFTWFNSPGALPPGATVINIPMGVPEGPDLKSAEKLKDDLDESDYMSPRKEALERELDEVLEKAY